MDRRLLLGGGVAALVAAALLWPRKQPSPEAQVRAVIASMVAAAEKKDLGALADAIADDFRGPSASSKQEVKQVLLGHLFRNQNAVVVFNPALEVRVTGDNASFNGVFVFARGKDVNWQEGGEGVSRYDIEGTLERRSGDWLVTSAEWKR
ncbi:MAG: hypothetical protein IAE78_01515 [Myxococcus sp.]|nr:hypothetical protein [Myxococcus sp.]